jgi:hypothetical protein
MHMLYNLPFYVFCIDDLANFLICNFFFNITRPVLVLKISNYNRSADTAYSVLGYDAVLIHQYFGGIFCFHQQGSWRRNV